MRDFRPRGNSRGRFGGNRSGSGGFSDRSGGFNAFAERNKDRFSRGRSSGRREGRAEMFDAVCSKCGKNCQVPFKPTGTKPVLCSDCFRPENSGSNFAPRSNDRPQSGISYDQFNQLNTKLNKILEILEQLEIVEAPEGDDEEDEDEELEEDA